MNEIWKAIPQYEGKYEVSTMGRVRCLKSTRARNDIALKEPLILKQYPHHIYKAYPRVVLWKNNKPKDIRVHRLVLQVFCGECPPNHVAAHLNGDANDNRLENLKWATRQENELHKKMHGTVCRGSRHHNSKLKEQYIPVIHRLSKDGVCSKDIAAKFKVHKTTINKVLKGLIWKDSNETSQA